MNLNESTSEGKRAVAEKIKNIRIELKAELDAYDKIALPTDKPHLTGLHEAFTRLTALDDRVQKISMLMNPGEAYRLSAEHAKDPMHWEAAIAELIQSNDQRLESKVQKAENQSDSARTVLVIVALTSALFAMGVGTTVFAGIKKNLDEKAVINANLERLVEVRTRALAESEMRLDLAIKGSGTGLWDWNLHTGETVFNERWAEIMGYRLGELAAVGIKTWMELCHPDDLAASDEALRRHFAGEVPVYDCECRMRHKDGRFVWVHGRGKVAEWDRHGKPRRMVGTHFDVTERRLAEDDVEKQRQRYRLLLQTSRDAIHIINTKGALVEWNDAFLTHLGYTSAEAQLLNVIDWDVQFGEEKLLEMIRSLIKKGRSFETRHRRKDGTIIDVEISAIGFTLEGEELLYASARDITQRKLFVRELIASRRAAEAADQAKSEFLANMSHEIRTPMNGVIGMTGLLLDTNLNAEQRVYAESARQCSESLLSLINDILDFSKIEARKLDLESLDFDLRSLMDDFALYLAARVQEKGLEFVCTVDPDVPAYLNGDPGRLRQVLVNLTGNAVKFTSQGEIVVRAVLAEENDNKVLVRFSVRDTGIGISEGMQGMLFQAFTQEDASTTRKYGGTGLGLAISKRLAELMGGEIGVISEKGKGSEFWFTARFAKQPRHEQAIPADIRGTRVLVVDDNAANRSALSIRLESWGVRAAGASDGQLAIQMLRLAIESGDPVQVAILDMQMPGMDGEILARTIKTDEKLVGTRLIAMTSMGLRGDAKHLKSIGFGAYLTKPIRQSDLFDSLSLVLAGEPARQSTQPIITRHSLRELHQCHARILLAEDNITNQQVALGVLNKMGYQNVDAVSNGNQVLRALENHSYDLVFMDLQMPEINGLSAAELIRSRNSMVRDHEIPIIALTAHAMRGDREACLAAGMNDYIAKPFTPQVLSAVLRKWLSKDRIYPTEVRSNEISDVRLMQAPESAVSSAIPVFEREALLTRLMGDENLALSIIIGFLEDFPRRLAALRRCIETNDAAGTTREAHTIKGAAAAVSGEAVRQIASQVEELGRAGDLRGASYLLSDLDAQSKQLKDALAVFVDR